METFILHVWVFYGIWIEATVCWLCVIRMQSAKIECIHHKWRHYIFRTIKSLKVLNNCVKDDENVRERFMLTSQTSSCAAKRKQGLLPDLGLHVLLTELWLLIWWIKAIFFRAPPLLFSIKRQVLCSSQNCAIMMNRGLLFIEEDKYRGEVTISVALNVLRSNKNNNNNNYNRTLHLYMFQVFLNRRWLWHHVHLIFSVSWLLIFPLN